MTRIIDLTRPIVDHFRWPVQRELQSSFADGAQFQVTRLGLAVHGFTHIDAPRHMLRDGATTSELRLEQVVGRAAVIDLTDVETNAPIPVDKLQQAGSHIEEGGIVLLKSCWDLRASVQEPEFWTTAPYLTRAGCDWLRTRSIRAIGFDFPQDYTIRLSLSGESAPIEEHVTHDILLRNGIIMIEYLCNMGEISTPFVDLYALPLKIPDADGAPARVIAIEGDCLDHRSA